MKKLLFLILVLFTANIAFSQITTNVSLKCQVYASSGTAPTFNVQSLVSDELSKYDGSSVAAGDKLFIIDGSECYELHISSVTLGSGSVLNFVAYDSTGVLTTVPNGQAAVIRKYNSQQVPFIPSGLRSDLSSCILQKIASTVNSLSGGSGVDNCTKTITQTAHGFGDGDVLFWDEAESEYVTFVGNYADATFPIYVVLDSLTANTFTGVSCGIIDEDFGLPEGLYYATNTGLSLTPAAIEYPVLKVYDSKSQVLAFPGLEFDATGKPLFDVLTSTGNHNFVGGQTLPLISDSIAVSLDTIAGVAVDNLQEALDALENAVPSGMITGNGTAGNIPMFTGTSTLGNSVMEQDSNRISILTKLSVGIADSTTNAIVRIKAPVLTGGVSLEMLNANNVPKHRFTFSTGAPHARYDIGDYSTTNVTALQQFSTELMFEPGSSNGGVYFTSNTSRYFRTNQIYSNINGLFIKDGSTTGWRTGTAFVQIDNTTKGFLGPRMTTAQRVAITMAAADAGLEVFDTDFAAKMVYDGTRWTGFRYNGTKFQGFDGTDWVDLN